MNNMQGLCLSLHGIYKITGTGGPEIVITRKSPPLADDLKMLFGAGVLGPLPDNELLTRFIQNEDVAEAQAAFSALVRGTGRWSWESAANAKRLKDRPFALLGVNCDEDRSAATKAMQSERITWPNWADGRPIPARS